MPLHLTWECIKCKNSGSQSLWSIRGNHCYSDRRNVCKHFDIIIDTVSSIGIFGYKWRNTITVTVIYNLNSARKNVIEDTFNGDNMEKQNYVIFNNIVFHARVSDSKGYYPTIGNSVQQDIEYNERLEEQKKEQQRREQERRLKLAKILDELEKEEKEEKKEEKKERKIEKKKNKLHQKIKQIHLDFDVIFDRIYSKQIVKSNNI